MEVFEGKQTMPVQWVLYDAKIYSEVDASQLNGRDGYAYPVTQVHYDRVDGIEWSPESWVMLCPTCGQIWARRYCLALPEINHWQVKRWPCRTHGNGSLWDAWNKNWNASLPFPLLVREMDILHDWWENGIRTHMEYFRQKHFRRKV